MCDYQCTSVSFIKLSNRIEKSIHQRESNRIELFFPNRNALLTTDTYSSSGAISWIQTHTSILLSYYLLKEFDIFIQRTDHCYTEDRCFPFLQHKRNFSFEDQANTFYRNIYLNCAGIIHIRGVCKIQLIQLSELQADERLRTGARERF